MRVITRGVLCIVVAGALNGCVTQQGYPEIPVPAPAPAPVVEAPAPAPSPAAPVPVSEKVSMMGEIRFSRTSATLSPEAKASLADLLNKVGSTRVEVFVVAGHAEDSLKWEKAKSLSQQRADATKDYLISRGIAPARIYTTAHGSDKPADTSGTTTGRAKNNRVDIEIMATRDANMDATGWMPNNVVSVLFATNRKRTGSDNPFYFYGNQLTDRVGEAVLERGVAAVRVPRERERGDLQRPSSVTLTIERVARNFGLRTLPTLLLPNPDNDFLYEHKIHVLKQAEFKSMLKDAVALSKGKTAVLYIHGYNNDFTEAAFRTAQLVYDMSEVDYDLVPLMFSWPSNPGIPGLDYVTAGKRTEVSSEALAAYLREIAQSTDIATVHIVAHSMGSRVLVSALDKLGTTKELTRQKEGTSVPVFKHIVFAAADITPEFFEKHIEPAIKSQHTVTSYVSSNDKVLWASKIVNQEPRIGFGFKHLPKCVDTIDVSAAGKGLAHSTWANSPRIIDDLRNMIRYNIAAARRGLRLRPNPAQAYWAFDRNPSATAKPFAREAHATLLPCNALVPGIAALVR